MEASSSPFRRGRVDWRVRLGLKIGKFTYRLLTFLPRLPRLNLLAGPSTTRAQPRHKITMSMDSGICIPYDDDEEDLPGLSNSQATLAAAVVVTPPPAIPTPPRALPTTSSHAPREPEDDPLFSMGLTLRSRRHIDEAISNGAFTFPYPNLAQDQEEINSFTHQLQQRVPIPIPQEPASTSPKTPPTPQPSLLAPWDEFDLDLTTRRAHISALTTTLHSLTTEATSLDAILTESTQSTRMDLQCANGHSVKTPSFVREMKRFHLAQQRLDRVHTEIDDARAQLADAVEDLDRLKHAQYLAD